MATEDQENLLASDPMETPKTNDLFAGQIEEEIFEQQVFVGDEDFYRSLSASLDPNLKSTILPTTTNNLKTRCIQITKIATTIGIVLIGALLLQQYLKSSTDKQEPAEPNTVSQKNHPQQAQKPVQTQTQQPIQQTQPPIQVRQPEPEPIKPLAQSPLAPPPVVQTTIKPKSTLPASYPISLQVAQDFYADGEYEKSYAAYNQLCSNLSDNMANQRDVLLLRMAMCIERCGDLEQAAKQLDVLTRSRSPIVSVMANYQLSTLQMQRNNFLKARSSVYKSLALANAINLDKNMSLSLQQDGSFFSAEAMTKKVLSLSNKDVELPVGLWKKPQPIDPFTNLDNDNLREFALSGIELLKTGILAPNVKRFEDKDGSPRWTVVCNGASIEELLSRFATEAGMDVVWDSQSTSNSESENTAIRKRPLILYLPAATPNEVITIAAGSVGLVAHLENSNTIRVYDPEQYASLSGHLQSLIAEAISLWQRFLLNFHGDQRTVNVHLILGILQSLQGQTTEAIAEYKLVANRFSNSPFAAHALLYSSRIKENLRDYLGAREYLKQLVEQYPDSEITERSYMYLADNTLKAGMKEQAAKDYIRVYNMSLSSKAQSTAALGAGKCYYETQQYEPAIKWLTQYITLSRNDNPDDLWLVYYMLGKSHLALGKSTEACQAFEYALAGQLSREQYVETISVLVTGYMEREEFIQALNILEGIQIGQFSQHDSVKITLFKSKVLRAMGLFDKAISTLGDKAEYTLDPQLSAQIAFELANCYIEQEDWEQAERKLTEVLVTVDSGPLMNQATIALAQVCFELGRDAQTISICIKLLDSDLQEELKKKALKLLVATYNRQQDYDRAALALLGKWNPNAN
ncbi:MAG: tetratricopeptide repeat protein [Sedimentisphaerales bacterium]|nr:tetratricopeptide repeat protein [Sedimentisphaerales bacterium]